MEQSYGPPCLLPLGCFSGLLPIPVHFLGNFMVSTFDPNSLLGRFMALPCLSRLSLGQCRDLRVWHRLVLWTVSWLLTLVAACPLDQFVVPTCGADFILDTFGVSTGGADYLLVTSMTVARIFSWTRSGSPQAARIPLGSFHDLRVWRRLLLQQSHDLHFRCGLSLGQIRGLHMWRGLSLGQVSTGGADYLSDVSLAFCRSQYIS